MEASPSPSSSATDLSTARKMGGRKTTRHPLYRGVRRRSSGREASKRSRLIYPEINIHGDGGIQLKSPADMIQRVNDVALQAARDHHFTTPASSSSSSSSTFINKLEGGSEVEFVDEEAMFNMPLLVECMAEGMLLTPPAMKKGFHWTHDHDVDFDFSIWD